MNSKVKSWGNSLAIRIPRLILNDLNLKEDDEVEFQVLDGSLLISKADKHPRYSLKELLDKVTPDNIPKDVWERT